MVYDQNVLAEAAAALGLEYMGSVGIVFLFKDILPLFAEFFPVGYLIGFLARERSVPLETPSKCTTTDSG